MLDTSPRTAGDEAIGSARDSSNAAIVADTGEVIPVAEIVPIGELMLRFVVAFHALNGRQECEGLLVSPRQARAMMHLARFPHRTMGELAEGLDISLSWASRVVDELVESGRVERVRDPDDRRVIHVRLTATARAIAERMLQQRGRVVANALASVAPAERPAILQFLRRLAPAVEALASQSAPPEPEMQITFGPPTP